MAESRTAEDKKLNIFISYSRQDFAFTDRLQVALKSRGIAAFVDREVEFANNLNKRFVPVVAGDLEGRTAPAALGRFNYIFFIPNPWNSRRSESLALRGSPRAVSFQADGPWRA